MKRPTDREWWTLRDAARRADWPEVERRCIYHGYLIVARHARRAASEPDSATVIRFALLMDKEDDPETYAYAAVGGRP